MDFKYLLFYLAAIISLIIGVFGYFTFKHGVIGARHDVYENVVLNKEKGIQGNDSNVYNPDFFVQEGLGETSDLFAVIFTNGIAESTVTLRVTGKKQIFKELNHSGIRFVQKDLVVSEFKNVYVLRTVLFTFLKDSQKTPIAIIVEKELKEVIYDNLSSIIIPILFPFLAFGASFVLVYFYKKELDARVQSESMLDMLNKSSLVSRTDTEGRIIYVNNKFCEIGQLLPQDILGKDYSVFSAGEQSKKFKEDLYRITVKFKEVWFDTITNKKHIDGSLYIVKRWIKAEFNSKGEHSGFISIRQDVTEEMRALEYIEKKNNQFQSLLSSVNHDLSGGVVQTNAGLKQLTLALKSEDKEWISDAVKLISLGVDQQSVRMDGIKNYLASIRDNIDIVLKEVDLKKVLDEYFSATSYRHQVEVANMGNIVTDMGLMSLVIVNLVKNGLKYNSSDNPRVLVTLMDGDIAIIDNGVGIDPEKFEWLCKYGTRSGSMFDTDEDKGTGYGLNICQNYLIELGMKMVCIRNQPNGTIIKIIQK